MYEGKEELINWDKIPPDLDDFPIEVQKAIIAFGKFPDRVDADLGYIGKDYTLFEAIKRIEFIHDESLFLETLFQLDSFHITKSRKDMEMARKAAKNGKK